MKKHTLSYLLSLYLGTIGPAFANTSAETQTALSESQPESFSMDTTELKEAMMSKIKELDLDMFSLLDVDNNQKLSRTECENSLNGFDSISVFSPIDSQEIRDAFTKAFDLFDHDKDGYLNKAESEEYFAHIYGLMGDAQINKMDLDKDGKVSLAEMTAYQKNLPSPEESMKKLEEATAKLKAITENPEQFAEQFIAKVSEAGNIEEANQMDSDADGKITSDEYVNYMFNHPNNKELNFSKEDYMEIYKQIDSSQQGFITEEEYIEFNQKQMKDVMEEAQKEFSAPVADGNKAEISTFPSEEVTPSLPSEKNDTSPVSSEESKDSQ